VAHEINNPLGGILNCIYHFKKGISSVVKQREYLDLMEDGVNRIQKTVKNLLEYARSPNLERSGSPTNIASLIEKPLSLLDYQIRGNQIEIRREIPQGLPPVVADKSQMGQVFVNIFLNAIQAMEGGGILKIKAEPLRDQILLAVSDTGKGIPKNALPRIFDPFFTTKGEGKGTGLGLWISQGIVERHGGTMQIESEEGKGTTVRIYFPVHQV
jgi:signal transduction histidine kinase